MVGLSPDLGESIVLTGLAGCEAFLRLVASRRCCGVGLWRLASRRCSLCSPAADDDCGNAVDGVVR